MPFYHALVRPELLTEPQRRQFAGQVVEVHCDVTGAPPSFVHLLVTEDHDRQLPEARTAVVNGTIRAGRNADQKAEIASRISVALWPTSLASNPTPSRRRHATSRPRTRWKAACSSPNPAPPKRPPGSPPDPRRRDGAVGVVGGVGFGVVGRAGRSVAGGAPRRCSVAPRDCRPSRNPGGDPAGTPPRPCDFCASGQPRRLAVDPFWFGAYDVSTCSVGCAVGRQWAGCGRAK